MSTYIMSDIHGSSKRFYEMLKLIQIDWSKDYLYINGDIVDRGKDSLKLFYEILEIKKQHGDHIVIIKGNHELFIDYYLSGYLPENLYSSFGGKDTIRELKALDYARKKELIEIIRKLPVYKEIISPVRGDMIIVHSGLHEDHIVKNVDDSINVIESIESALRRDEYEYLISGYLQYDAPAWITKGLDKVMCVGHVPTMYLPDIQAPVICMKSGGKVIMTDCGAGHPGGRLGCIRLEDEKLFYVE